MAKRVVITGMGVVAPNGHGLKNFEAALRAGQSGIRTVPFMKELGFACHVGGWIDGVDELAARYFTPDIRMAMKARVLTFASVAAIDAWTDAGLKVPEATGDQVNWDTGAVIGTGAAALEFGADVGLQVRAGKVRRLGSTTTEQTMVSGVSARITGLLALGGPVTTNSTACTTGLDAIIQAYHTIREGRSERMLAGGAEGGGEVSWSGFDAMRVLPTNRNDTPEKASRPMSASASGFVPGSGAGVLFMESLESARGRGARIYAEIISGNVTCGGHRNGGSMTAPNPEGVKRCLRKAISDAGIRPEEIDAINGHLTATMADPLELANWHAVLGLPHARFPWINSTKSMIGHGLGAAGAVESVAALLQLYHGFVHASINCEDIHPQIEAFAARIPQQTVKADLRVLAKASFGFGDVNGCVLFRKWEK